MGAEVVIECNVIAPSESRFAAAYRADFGRGRSFGCEREIQLQRLNGEFGGIAALPLSSLVYTAPYGGRKLNCVLRFSHIEKLTIGGKRVKDVPRMGLKRFESQPVSLQGGLMF